MIYQTFVADGIDLLVSPVSFDAASGASTLIGATVTAWAQNTSFTVKVAAASCTVVSATSIRATWAPGTVPAGTYSVQVFAAPIGHAIQTVCDTVWTVKPSAGP